MFLCGMFEVERCKLGTGFPFHSEQFSQQKSMVQVTFLHAYFQIFYVVTNRYRCNILTYSISHNSNLQMQTLTSFLYAPFGLLVLHNPGVYTNGYSVYVCTLCVLGNGGLS